jgi:3-oxoacyl-[acyl-carrier-protein] synthase II
VPARPVDFKFRNLPARFYRSPAVPTHPPQRIFITGAGIISPLGMNWRENEAALQADRTSFRPVTLFDVSERIAKTAASVDLPQERLFRKVPRRREHLIDRSTKMLLLAIREALQMARLPGLQGIDAMILGTSAAAMMVGQDYFRHAVASPNRQPGQLSRLEYYQPQRQLRIIAEEFGWQGPLIVVSNACASGANAIGDAMAMIRSGRARRVLSGGYDALAELVFSGFDTLRALAPSGIPRPFDANRDGLALGEGAGVFILESAEAAAERGAQVLGEAAGYAIATDLHHLTQPDPMGQAAARTMAGACAMAGLAAEQIGYINSHGTGTPYNDVSEAAAISAWAGEAAAKIAVSSTKSAMGHLLGGAGAVEAVISLMALRGQWVPGSLNIRNADPAVTFDLVQSFRPAALQAVLTNSFGFGGTNASLVLAEAGWAPLRPSPQRWPAGALKIRGIGAVSPAGWGAPELARLLTSGAAPSPGEPPRSKGARAWNCRSLAVPPAPAELLPKFSRLRRASAITRFAMGAALEALASAGFPKGEGAGRLGIIQCMFNGCVQFSGRFYQEVLDTPALASPLVFPETVYNAPASHVAAYLGVDGPVTTLVGEGNIVMEALALAKAWLAEGLVDHCLILGAEESDWLGAEAATYYHRKLMASEGAGALVVGLGSDGLEIRETAARHFSSGAQRQAALRDVAEETLRQGAVSILVDRRSGIAPLDDEEQLAWRGIDGAQRLHPRAVMGEGMGCAGTLQLVLAAAVAQERSVPVHVSLPGSIGSVYSAVVAP